MTVTFQRKQRERHIGDAGDAPIGKSLHLQAKKARHQIAADDASVTQR
jgi:hypothetical protein